MSAALLFERDHVAEVEWGEGLPRLGRSSVLWIDLERPTPEEIEALAASLDLTPESVNVLGAGEARTPMFADFGTYLHVTVLAPARDNPTPISCLVAERWLVTVREQELEVIDSFRERASGSGDVGALDGMELLANIVEWTLASYLEEFERIEVALEEIDAAAMSGNLDERESVISRLVDVRREIAKLRRALTSHRVTILALAHPELQAVASSSSASRFASLQARLEEAVAAARDSRESVVGSFDIVVARTAERTNDIMKILTLVSVLILPGTLLAGVMGMNFRVGIFQNATYFWVVVACMAVLALATLVIARLRDWI